MRSILTQPRIQIEAGGHLFSESETLLITNVVVQQELSAPAMCELTLVGATGDLSVMDSLAVGSTLRLYLETATDPVFSGDITALEHIYDADGCALYVRAYDVLHRLMKQQPVRVHAESGPLDLAREMAGDLQLYVSGDERGPVWQKLFQYRQSDFELLVESAARAGLYLTVRGNELLMRNLEGDEHDSVFLRLGDNLHEARFEQNAAQSCGSVQTLAWDPAHLTCHEGSAGEPRTQGASAAPTQTSTFGACQRKTFANQTSPNAAYATSVAQGELDYRSASQVIFSGLVQGDASLRPLQQVNVAGVAAALAGSFVLTSCRHVVDRDRGYVTEISSQPPLRRPRQEGFFAVPGKVSRVDDPEALGRVCLTLPTCGNLETDWMCSLAVGAGAAKGLMALSDIGDEVLALVSVENPAVGIVLGSVFGSHGMPDSGIEKGVVARYTFLTPGGQRLRLDDTGNSIHLENKNGSFVELKPDKVTLHANADLLLEAPGRNIVIQGEKVDFRRA